MADPVSIGIQLAVGIGLSLLSNALKKDTASEGSRIEDLSVSSSTYGKTIPIGYGTHRFVGNMLWSTGLEEKTNAETTGGKGGPQHVATTYSYSASFAMGFCAGPAAEIMKIWADNKLVFSRTSEVADDPFTFRFYQGDETQTADSLIVADKGTSAPGYRGLCYIVFDNIALSAYGNRIPSISVELAFNATPSYPKATADSITSGEGGIFATEAISTTTNGLAVNWITRKAFGWSNSVDYGMRVINVDTMNEIQQKAGVDMVTGVAIGGDSHIVLDQQGSGLYLVYDDGSNSNAIIRMDQNSLTETARFGTASAGTTFTSTEFTKPHRMAVIHPVSGTGLKPYLIVGSKTTNGWIGILDATTMAFVYHIPAALTGVEILGICEGKSETGSAQAWIITTDAGTNDVRIYTLTVPDTASASNTTGIILNLEVTLKPSDLLGPDVAYIDSDPITYVGPVYNKIHDSVIIFAQGGTKATRLFAWSIPIPNQVGVGLKWVQGMELSTDQMVVGTDNVFVQSWINSDTSKNTIGIRTGVGNVATYRTFSTINGFPGAQVTAATGSYITNTSAPQIFNGDSHALMTIETGQLNQSYLGRVTGTDVTLQSIISDLCSRGGLTGADIDFIGFSGTDLVRGYKVTNASTMSSALSQLALAFFFDGVESDYKIKFIKKATDPIVFIPQQDLAALDSNGTYLKESRVQEVELPARVNVHYTDLTADYEPGIQHFKRVSTPAPTMYSRQQVSIELPIVLSPSEAKQIAEKTLFTEWIERTSYSAKLPWKYLKYDPTDIVVIQLDNGKSYTTRIDKLNVGADMSLEFQGTVTASDLYSSTAVGNSGAHQPQTTNNYSNVHSKLFLFNTPLLVSGDDTGGNASRGYVGVGSYKAGWPSAIAYKSIDNIAFNQLAGLPNQLTWGTTANKLDYTATPFATDFVNTLTVFLQTDSATLSSVTEEQLLAGSNAALVGDELIQYKTATLQTDGSYILSELLRGRRGTEEEVGNHASGEDIVIISLANLTKISVPLDEIDKTRYFKAVTSGQAQTDAIVSAEQWGGNDLKPYAPVSMERVINGADLDISWIRRDRLYGADLVDGTDVIALAETKEEYEVYILKAPYDSETFDPTSTTLFYYKFDSLEGTKPITPTVKWLSADFNGFNLSTDTLHLAIFQLSTVVGRGFSGTASILA